MENNIPDKLGHCPELSGKIKENVADEAAAVRILGEVAKDARMEKIKQEREAQNYDLATPRQLAYLQRLSVVIPENLTKTQASEFIYNALEREY